MSKITILITGGIFTLICLVALIVLNVGLVNAIRTEGGYWEKEMLRVVLLLLVYGMVAPNFYYKLTEHQQDEQATPAQDAPVD